MPKPIPVFLFIFFVGIVACTEKTDVDTTLIQNVKIVDGSGTASFISSLRINGDKIEAIGILDAIIGETIINGEGLVLAPGFIDTHSHHDWDTLSTVEAAISQGITTIIVGQDGGSHFPLKTYIDSLERFPLALNLATYAEMISRCSAVGKSTKKIPSNRSARANSGGNFEMSLHVATKNTSLVWSLSQVSKLPNSLAETPESA